MTIIYRGGFDTSNLLAGVKFQITVTRAGESNATIDDDDLAAATSNTTGSRKFVHDYHIAGALAPNTGTVVYPYSDWADCTFATAVGEALTAATTGWAGPPTFTCSFSSHKYTISVSGGGNFGITWGNASSYFLMGYTGDLSGATSYEATYYPLFYLPATLTELSQVSDYYEPDSMAGLAVSDSGIPQDAISRTYSPYYFDWVQEYEPKSSAIFYAVNGPNLCSFDYFYKWGRSEYPLIVTGTHIYLALLSGYLDLVMQLRPEETAYKPIRAHPEYDDFWHVPFKTLWVAYKVAT